VHGQNLRQTSIEVGSRLLLYELDHKCGLGPLETISQLHPCSTAQKERIVMKKGPWSLDFDIGHDTLSGMRLISIV
jgi:hypothetical protein